MHSSVSTVEKLSRITKPNLNDKRVMIALPDFPYLRTAFRLLFAVVPLIAASCSSESAGRVPVFPVRGECFVNGEPAERAIVIFHPISASEPKTTNPNGRVQADGSFQLTTYESGDGAPAGDYAVTIFWPEPPKSPIAHPDMGPDRLKNRYMNPGTSKIHITVKEGENLLHPIRLDVKGLP